MYSKYNKCPVTRPIQQPMYCKPIISNATPMSESERMTKNRCAEYIVKPTPASSCEIYEKQITIPVTPGMSIPYTEVKNNPASATISINASTSEDVYDPVDRFRKYFPPPPIPYQCPVRIPNNYPLPSTQPCIPFVRFQGSRIDENYIDDE